VRDPTLYDARARLRWAVGTAVLVAVLDQGIKQLVSVMLAACPAGRALAACPRLLLPGGIGLVRVESNGGLPGLLAPVDLATLIAVMGVLFVLLYARRLDRPARPAGIAIGLQLGGALSNLADRLIRGASLDYLPVRPVVFNLADVALLVGMLLAVWLLMNRSRWTADRVVRRTPEA
jgi:lipoprotein signal peptidase